MVFVENDLFTNEVNSIAGYGGKINFVKTSHR